MITVSNRTISGVNAIMLYYRVQHAYYVNQMDIYCSVQNWRVVRAQYQFQIPYDALHMGSGPTAPANCIQDIWIDSNFLKH